MLENSRSSKPNHLLPLVVNLFDVVSANMQTILIDRRERENEKQGEMEVDSPSAVVKTKLKEIITRLNTEQSWLAVRRYYEDQSSSHLDKIGNWSFVIEQWSFWLRFDRLTDICQGVNVFQSNQRKQEKKSNPRTHSSFRTTCETIGSMTKTENIQDRQEVC